MGDVNLRSSLGLVVYLRFYDHTVHTNPVQHLKPAESELTEEGTRLYATGHVIIMFSRLAIVIADAHISLGQRRLTIVVIKG